MLDDLDEALAAAAAAEATAASADSAQPPPKARLPLSDHITLCAFEFERALTSLPIPDAFLAAAGVAAHGNDPVRFESARQVTHYVSCPPGRDKAVAAPKPLVAAAAPEAPVCEDVSSLLPDDGSAVERPTSLAILEGTADDTPVASAGAAPKAVAAPLPGILRASESAILEPESAMYLLDVLGPAKLHVIVHPSQVERYASVLGWAPSSPVTPEQLAAPLTAEQLWRVFCGRLSNFPARFAVYRHFRVAGWVVRDGAAFGADFSLYTSGPGQDHSVHTVLVMPLQVAEVTDGPPGAASAAEATAAPGTAAADAPIPVRAVPWSVCSTWVETHAHGRVIGSVRKHMVLAYVSMPVERGAAAAWAAARGEGATASQLPAVTADAIAVPEEEGCDRITAGIEAAVASAEFYPPWLASRLTTPASIRALPVEIAGSECGRR